MTADEIDFARLSELDYFFGYEPVATALNVLADPDETEGLKSTHVGKLTDPIFHQTSTRSGTYGVVPYLEKLVGSQPPAVQFQIIHLAGWIALQRGPVPGDLTEAEWQAYQQCKPHLAAAAVELFKTMTPKNSVNHQNLLAAIATLSGYHDDGWRLCHLLEEDKHDCPSCGDSFLSEGLAVPYRKELNHQDYLLDAGGPMYAYPVHRHVNGVPVTPRTTWPADHLSTTLFELAISSNNDTIGQWLANFYGSANCPNCGEGIAFA